MVAAPPPLAPNFRGEDLKISDQNNWEGLEQKIKFGGGAEFQGGPMNPNDVMIAALKVIILC